MRKISTRRRTAAVVLAGGFGTRLSPLTDTKPKPLIKILDKTVLETVLSAVKKTESERIFVTTFYKSGMIEAECEKWGNNIACEREKSPLGTAGGVRNCYDGKYDALLVVSGDAVFDFSLQDIIDFHYDKANDVTIAVSRKENPTEYGVVICDNDGNVERFDEKPPWKKVKSDLVNTGIYVLSRLAVDSIPENTNYDFSKHLFPKLMMEGRRVMAYPADGFWCDVGTLNEYMNCNVFALENRLSNVKNDGKTNDSLMREGIHVGGSVYVSKDAAVGKNVSIKDGCIICENAVIGDNCDISSSLVGEGTRIGKGSSVTGAILAENVSVGENCIIPEGTVIGGGCRISDGTVVKRNRHIKAQTALFGEDVDKMDFENKGVAFVDDGVCIIRGENVYSELVNLAKTVGLVGRENTGREVSVCVMCEQKARKYKNALICGFEGIAGRVFDCSCGNEALLSYGVKKTEADYGVFVNEKDNGVCVTLISRDGCRIQCEDEIKISKMYSAADKSESFADEDAVNTEIAALPLYDMYKNSLLKFTEKLLYKVDFSHLEVSVSQKCEQKNPAFACLVQVLRQKKCKLSGVSDKSIMNVCLSDDGMSSEIRVGENVVDNLHMCAVVCKNKDVFNDETAFSVKNVPFAVKPMLRKNEISTPDAFCITSDGNSCILAFLSVLALRAESVETLLSEIPSFAVFCDDYIADINRGATMERLSKLYSDTKDGEDGGITLSLADGNVTVIPNRAKGFRIVAESFNMEAAKELCFKVGKAIKS